MVKRRIMLFLVDTFGVSKRTNELLKEIVQTIALLTWALAMCIDWDKTFDIWGVMK